MTRLFHKSKMKVLENLQAGIKTFDMTTQTILSTDWSKDGVGYIMSQKTCKCEKINLKCRVSGWSTVLLFQS